MSFSKYVCQLLRNDLIRAGVLDVTPVQEAAALRAKFEELAAQIESLNGQVDGRRTAENGPSQPAVPFPQTVRAEVPQL